MSESQFKRGDVVLVPFPFVTDFSKAKTRPAVVIQNDMGNLHSPNLILALISTSIPRKDYPFHYRIVVDSKSAKQSGLSQDSIVKAEIIITIPRSCVVKKIGSFPKEEMEKIDQCLRVSLNL